MGYDPSEYVHLRRVQVLADQGVDLLLDVGANTGQHARNLRNEGFRGRIVSYEPTGHVFGALEGNAAGDDRWQCRQLALSDEPGTLQIRVFEDTRYNSLLGANGEGMPSSTGVEDVEVTTLDGLEGEDWSRDDRLALKIDVQGLELSVLNGAPNLLQTARVVEVELSMKPLYEGQALFPEISALLYDAGFEMVSFRPINSRANGDLVQADGTFVRTASTG